MLHLHRAERSDRLAEALGEVLRVPLADPFTPEVVAVPAKGVERWLGQRLSAVLGAADGDGVTANVVFPSPARLVGEVLSRVDPDDDPWSPGRLLWTVLGVLDACVGEPWCAVLATHLGARRRQRPARPAVGDGRPADPPPHDVRRRAPRDARRLGRRPRHRRHRRAAAR